MPETRRGHDAIPSPRPGSARPDGEQEWQVAAMPARHLSGWSSGLAVEEGVQVGAEGFGVRDCAVDVGGGAGAEYRHAEEVEPGGAGDHPAVVADLAGVVAHTDVQPGVVGPEARRP